MSLERAAFGAMLEDHIPRERAEYQQFRPKPRRARPRRWLVWTSLTLSDLALAGLALMLFQGGGRGVVAAVATPARLPAAFVEDRGLAPMLSFDPPEAGRYPPRYHARMRPGGAERADTLTYGEIGGDGLFFRVAARAGELASPQSSLFVEFAKQSAEMGAAVVRATNPETYAGARGPVEWADVTLSGRGGERSCIGFRLQRGAQAELSGLACGARAAPILDPAALGCLLDRLSVTQAGMEAGLGEALSGDLPPAAACQNIAG